MVSVNDAALVGKVLGERYRLTEVIGQGTTGMVFAAEHVTFARPAAVKVVRGRHAAPELVRGVFSGDAFTAWGLVHPSLCEVFDVGAVPDGTPYFVMERLEGETLATRVARERLSLAAGIDMMMQLMSAIVAMHARELLVRDLRPCNVFLAHRRGCRPLVKIMDIGLARLAPIDRLQEQWMTAGPQPGGHPHYLSPERARGEHLVDVTSDIFVAGAIFYEALAGERAFGGASWRTVVDQITRGEPALLHDKRRDIPVELSQFVARCLSANPRSRPQTAKEMQDELRAIFEDARKASVSIYAPPPSAAAAQSGITKKKDDVHRSDVPSSNTPPTTRIASESYTDETETRRAPRSTRAADLPPPAPPSRPVPPTPPPPPDPHPAMLDDQTLERLDSPGSAAARKAAINAIVGPEGEEDETQTTKMSPELRARIDALMSVPPSTAIPRSKK